MLYQLNNFQIFVLKGLRKAFQAIFGKVIHPYPECIQDSDKVSNLIYESLMADKPCMVARFGAFELSVLINYLGVLKGKNMIDYISLKQPQWWWQESLLKSLNSNAGFFPPTIEKIEQFCQLIIKDISEVDVLGSWMHDEVFFEDQLKKATKIKLKYLDPYWSKQPWTRALSKKKILVIHPFAESIKKQYTKRELLFSRNDFLTDFKSFSVIKAVQSIGNEHSPFNDWFEALEFMKSEMDRVDYDICLIGCGAYGFPLAAHAKRMGKKAVHMGGSLQLLFGIKGKRWEAFNPHFEPGNDILIDYKNLPNEHWVRPSEEEKPVNHSKVEDSCYW